MNSFSFGLVSIHALASPAAQASIFVLLSCFDLDVQFVLVIHPSHFKDSMNDSEFVDLVNELAALPESYHFTGSGSASQLDLPEDQRGPPDVIFKAIDQLNPNAEKGEAVSMIVFIGLESLCLPE